jgi:NAD(P)-dependent dehydrogenase (short-subunit alcohol dehydrogenase family)
MTTSTQTTPGIGEFNGKRVLVTGGTKGAGKAVADRFLQGGATVIITARSAPDEKSKSHFIQADVSTSDGTTKSFMRFWKALRESMLSFTTWEEHPRRAAALSRSPTSYGSRP